jgi:catechol 2,3-dioxygenase-like lactoylglutathione lyase family enzyme
LTLQHVGIEIVPAEVERAVGFFALLGFERVQPPPGLREGFTWVQRDGTQIHLMHTKTPTVPPRAHLAVVVEDFDAAVAALREAGFEVEPGTEYWGAPRAKTHAPGGQRVELMAAPPTAG